MKLIYIAGPYRAPSEWGVTQNIRKAEAVAIILWGKGWSVFCPHKNTAYFGGLLSDRTWLDGDLVILERCDAICMMDGWENSQGAQVEHSRAVELGMPIYYEADNVPVLGDKEGTRRLNE